MKMKSLGYKIYRKGCYFFRKIQIKVAKNENALNQDIREEKRWSDGGDGAFEQ